MRSPASRRTPPRLVALAAALLLAPLPLQSQVPDTTRREPPQAPAPADSAVDPRAAEAARDTTRDLLGPYADLGLQLRARLEAKTERQRNERCVSSQFFTFGSACRSQFQPNVDFQFTILTGGTVADRIHLNVDYDSEREFDASNNVSIYYQGMPDEWLERVEIGNVSFGLPPSRYLGAGVPSGNYGLQAIARWGPMRMRAIWAQQKGNVVRDRIFTIGDRSLQSTRREIEDYQLEPRRFFFTVDPTLLPGYPDIDILDGERMRTIAETLPDDVRPSRVFLYRLQLGGQPPNPTGPQFLVRGGNLPQSRGQVYEYLREGVDYYVDPSQLWVALVRPLNVNTERLVVAYRVRMGGVETTSDAGGTPDLTFQQRDQFANLLWDPTLRPDDPVFDREIRSVYRIGGGDILRQTVGLTIVSGAGQQEKPVAGTADTYLEMFGLSTPTNPSEFDVENRLWPRQSDPIYSMNAGGTDSRIINDQFLVFPSLRPFARDGLVDPGNPANDTLYRVPGEDLYSQRRPQTVYRMRVVYDAEGGGDRGSLMLGAVQLRQSSERIFVDGVPLVRGTDYQIDYDLGRVSFTRADTLFARERRVSVQYEESPLFAPTPTRLYGLASQFRTGYGDVHVTFLSQAQRTNYFRPALGFEPLASLLGGISADFTFDASPLSRAIARLPAALDTVLPSTIRFQGEFAATKPLPHAEGVAYLESFDGESGINVVLGDVAWYHGSRPLPGSTFDPNLFSLDRASTMAWQSNPLRADGTPLLYGIADIDPLVRFTGLGVAAEQLLWLSLYPRSIGGQYERGTEPPRFRWQIADPVPGRRWRSVRTLLSTAGLDITRLEHLEFWTLLDTTMVGRARNPVLVFDLGDISENSVTFAPETLYIRPAAGDPSRADSTWGGRRLEGFDRMDTERDSLSRSFNVVENDVGLPGDRASLLTVVDEIHGEVRQEANVAVCRARPGELQRLGDTRTNCTVGNLRMDEEDLDGDFVLNMVDANQEQQERVLRYVVDLGQAGSYTRIGHCREGQCWVQVRLPLALPVERINQPNVRRIRAMRLTVVSAADAPDDAFTQLPIAQLRLAGPPWLKRADHVLAGIAGTEEAGGFVIPSLIGTNDYTAALPYESPPGVEETGTERGDELQVGRRVINERALRLQSSVLPLHHRAEAYYRFPEGQKSFMGYTTLRLWARGRGTGWGGGPNAELELYVKLGRDENNFYMYRTPANAGPTRNAWEPEVRVHFERFFVLRETIQNAYLQGGARIQGCTGADSALIAATPVPDGAPGGPYVACSEGYIVFTADPNLTPPNLAAVQEMAVGILRVRDGTTVPGTIAAGDTLEVWVNEIRLGGVVSTAGFAGQAGLAIQAGGLGDLRVSLSRRDPHFRHLGEQATFITDDAIDVQSTVRLDRFLPRALGLAMPLSISHTTMGSDPLFVTGSDIRGGNITGLRTPRSSATSYTLSLRRTTPVEVRYLAPLLNHLSLNSSYSSASSRSEYTQGGARAWTVGLDYTIAAADRQVGLPGWLESALEALPDWLSESAPIRRARAGTLRWSPTHFRVTSGVSRAEDRRLSFFKPAEAPDDDPREVVGLNHVWRNASQLELRPVRSLGLRWNVASIRDLRDYGDDTPSGIAAGRARSGIGGVDVGLERERTMTAGFDYAPAVAEWLRPSLAVSTSFALRRDPNTRTVLGDTADAASLELPRRLTSQQSLAAGTLLDLAGALRRFTGDTGRVRRLLRAFQPVDVRYDRSLLSAFDRGGFTPPLGYQLALGGVNDFRSVEGELATSAGVTHTYSLGGGLVLPFGTTLTNRYRHTIGRSWIRREPTRHAVMETESVSFPDASLRWAFTPAGALGTVLRNVATQVGVRRTLGTTLIPLDIAGGDVEQSRSDTRQFPVSASFAWAGGVQTSGSFNLVVRDDERPGSLGESRTEDLAFDVSRAFGMPARFDLRSDLRVRAGWQQSHTESYTFQPDGGARSRLADNGRRAFNLSADTDFADNVTFSLQGARVVTFDDNFGRRYTQTMISAVMQIQFYSGELR